MTRILFLGDTAGTGFGTVTRDLGAALLARGEDVRFLSLNEGPDDEADGPFVGRVAVLGLPDGWLAASETTARIEGMFTGGLFADGWTPEAAIVLGDMGSLKVSPVLGLIPPGFPVHHYVPIEGTWLPPAWGAIWQRIHPVAMCEFGADEIAKVAGARPPVVYHGVDTETFFPVSPERRIVMPGAHGITVLRSKADCRRFLGWPEEAFILYRADRHMPRKDYPALFRAVAPFLAAHGEAMLLVHALIRDQGGDFMDDVSHFGPLASRIGFSGIGGSADRRLLNVMYNAPDLYVSTSAEGFGLTIAESLAAGTPAVAMDYSSVTEVVGPGGLLVPPANPVDNIYSYFWAHVDEGRFGAAIEHLYRTRNELALLGLRGREHVRASFRWDTAAEQFSAIVAQQEAVAA